MTVVKVIWFAFSFCLLSFVKYFLRAKIHTIAPYLTIFGCCGCSSTVLGSLPTYMTDSFCFSATLEHNYSWCKSSALLLNFLYLYNFWGSLIILTFRSDKQFDIWLLLLPWDTFLPDFTPYIFARSVGLSSREFTLLLYYLVLAG